MCLTVPIICPPHTNIAISLNVSIDNDIDKIKFRLLRCSLKLLFSNFHDPVQFGLSFLFLPGIHCGIVVLKCPLDFSQ